MRRTIGIGRRFSLLLVCGGVWAVACPLLAQETRTIPDGYVGRTPPQPGLAPKMKVTELVKTGRDFELVFGKGDEIASGLAEFAEKYHLKTGHFTAIGALDSAVLGWFDPEKRAYKKISINQEAEIISFTGNIVTTNGKPNVHAHVVLALPDGTTRGGHLVEAHVSLTLQLFLEELDAAAASAAAKANSDSKPEGAR